MALHAASAMFTNSDKYLSLVGAQFQRHAAANEFKVEVTQPSHPVMQGVQSFTSFDEPYVHIKHNPQDRTVLMERPDPAGTREPWTWVRTQGQGHVFYTASGHDERTWDRPEFQKMIANAVIWTLDAQTRQAFQRFEMPGVDLRGRLHGPELRAPQSGAEISDAVRAGSRATSSCRRRRSSTSSCSRASR